MHTWPNFHRRIPTEPKPSLCATELFGGYTSSYHLQALSHSHNCLESFCQSDRSIWGILRLRSEESPEGQGFCQLDSRSWRFHRSIWLCYSDEYIHLCVYFPGRFQDNTWVSWDNQLDRSAWHFWIDAYIWTAGRNTYAKRCLECNECIIRLKADC